MTGGVRHRSGSRLSRALWFIGLWAGGVLVVGAAAWLVRLALAA